MLTTQFDGGLRARPLEARPDRGAGLIWFVTDLRSGKEHEIEAEHDVGLVFIDPQGQCLSVDHRSRAGPARSRQGRGHLEDHRQCSGGAGPTIPTSACCAFSRSRASYGMGRRARRWRSFEFAKARLTGEKPNLGENRKVTVQM